MTLSCGYLDLVMGILSLYMTIMCRERMLCSHSVTMPHNNNNIIIHRNSMNIGGRKPHLFNRIFVNYETLKAHIVMVILFASSGNIR